MGGLFASYNGSAAYRIARLNTNGNLDTEFLTPSPGFNDIVNTIATLENNKTFFSWVWYLKLYN